MAWLHRRRFAEARRRHPLQLGPNIPVILVDVSHASHVEVSRVLGVSAPGQGLKLQAIAGPRALARNASCPLQGAFPDRGSSAWTVGFGYCQSGTPSPKSTTLKMFLLVS